MGAQCSQDPDGVRQPPKAVKRLQPAYNPDDMQLKDEDVAVGAAPVDDSTYSTHSNSQPSNISADLSALSALPDPSPPMLTSVPAQLKEQSPRIASSTRGFRRARYSSQNLVNCTGFEEACDSLAPRKRIYFIRHAEAIHNVAEKKAKAQARARGERGSLTEEEIKSLEEEARAQVLENPSFYDPPLSDQGVQQAQRLHAALEGLFDDGSRYVRPSLILVSPLERTMQTMLHVFPDFEWQKERVVPMEVAALLQAAICIPQHRVAA